MKEEISNVPRADGLFTTVLGVNTSIVRCMTSLSRKFDNYCDGGLLPRRRVGARSVKKNRK